MDTETKTERGFRLSMEQQAEIGDILLSARAVAQQMTAKAEEEANRLVSEAQARAEEILRVAEQTQHEAEEKADRLVREAEEKAAALLREAEEKTAPPAPEPSVTEAELQEFAVRAVENCFAALRRQQLDAVELINEHWRHFLSELSFSQPPDSLGERPDPPPVPEVSQRDIEDRVNAIARELMEIIGSNEEEFVLK